MEYKILPHIQIAALGTTRHYFSFCILKQIFACSNKMLKLSRMGWGGRRDGGSGWGTHVNPWLIHVNVWQKPLQYCKVISLQLKKIDEKKKKVGSHFRINNLHLCNNQ